MYMFLHFSKSFHATCVIVSIIIQLAMQYIFITFLVAGCSGVLMLFDNHNMTGYGCKFIEKFSALGLLYDVRKLNISRHL